MDEHILDKFNHKGKQYIITNDVECFEGIFKEYFTTIRIKIRKRFLWFTWWSILKTYKYDNKSTRTIQIHNATRWVKRNILNK